METMIETARLALRRPTEDDLDPLAAINADPEVMRYIADGQTKSRDETAAGLARAAQEWDERGFGMFSVDLRDAEQTWDGEQPWDAEQPAKSQFIGWVALTEPAFLPEVMPAVEIGWRLAREHWGRGYATEAARAALRFGFEECGFDRIISIRDLDNDASRRVMEKLGLRFGHETVVPASKQKVAVYEISRETYEALQQHNR